MAMNVGFKQGSASKLPATRDSNTFYYVTDTFALYLGSHLISNEVTATQFAALEARVKEVEDLDFQTQIDTINETLKSIATSDTVIAIDNRLKAVEADYLKAADKTELEGKITTAQNKADDAYALADAAQTAEEVSAAITNAINALDINQYTTEAEVLSVVNTAIAGVSNSDTINSITELVNYLNTHGADAEEMAATIDKLEKMLDGFEASTGSVKTYVDNAKSTAVSEAQSYTNTQLEGYVAKETGKGLSTNDYTTAEKTKLSGVAAGAQVNVLEGVQFNGVDLTITNKKVNVQAATVAQAQQGIDDAANALSVANSKTTLAEVKSTIQGNTEVTIEACVKAINELNSGVTNQTASIGTIEGNVKDIVEQLTWGSF